MEVETRKPPQSEIWTRWEGQMVNGAFPLHRCLGSSDHSGVFLTRYAEHSLPNVALKLVPAIPTLAESQLSHWNAAGELEHPHLVRLFKSGRCQLGGSHYLYVVMDYAEQNLAQLLLHRALSEVEVREMLPLTLEALAFLHARNLVHGQLKPSNVLVVENRLALASDTVRPADEATASIGMLSIHNPPEARDGSFSAAGDVWALGVTVCQALTQRTPLRSSERRDLVVLPPDVPEAFTDILRRCLSSNPAQRPSVADLQEWLRKGGGAPAPSDSALPSSDSATSSAEGAASPSVTAASPAPAAVPVATTGAATTVKAERNNATRLVIRAVIDSEPPAPEAAERRSFVPLIVGAVAVAAVGWGAVSWYRGHSHAKPEPAGQAAVADSRGTGVSADAQSTEGVPPNSQNSGDSAAGAGSSTPPDTTQPPSNASGRGTSSNPGAVSRAGSTHGDGATAMAVVHEDIPSVPPYARSTIHGHVKVTVRVAVDSAGAVMSDTLARPGPSKYFARLASESARRWRFGPATGPGSREALIRFEFTRSNTTAHVVSAD